MTMTHTATPVQGICPAFEPYIPTAEDIENDRKLEAWRKRQREADARVILSQIEVKRRAAVKHCIDAWEARIGSDA